MASTESAPADVPAQTPDVSVDAPKTETPATTTSTSSAPTTATPAASDDSGKPIHTLVVDTGPIIKNDPAVSTLLAQAECLVTIPSVVDEIRDPATRARVQTTLLPFLTLRTPKAESVKFVSDFARKTGDLEVLSRPDLQLLALTYELECERNGGDWRLRKTPAQKGVNGKSPAAIAAEAAAAEEAAKKEEEKEETQTAESAEPAATLEDKVAELSIEEAKPAEETKETKETEGTQTTEETTEATEAPEEEEEEDEDDGGGEWITPSNLKKHKEKESVGAPTQPIQRRLQAALLTSDFAMQNVALRINLNLLSPSLDRITRVKTWVLRCHGCFTVTRQMDKQFCPQCGQATLTRTSCATNGATGEFQIFLKKNFQYNKRGNVYSVPKPVHGSASGKFDKNVQGGRGGHNGWGRDLILSEDQQEYTRRVEEQKRLRVRDMMDEDYLPNILTGFRNAEYQAKMRVGAGRNVNAKKRK
ncbi:20S-pre-rRNA D-site endonuclease nob1 [Sporothrix bragantina]|uniref:20S-pre-rRNA D-site endonuclease NOB1 n=1 Tax=Sporothrix bragantina TaxID=671064 RepID=A0ABP0B2R7_9PEZI